jgi:hypothetical protein
MSGSKLSDASSSHPAGHDEPLPLTVYALPVPDEAMREDSGRRVWQGRWKMIIVALVCAAPVIASYFTYYVIRPEGRRNHGELIDPLRPLPDLATTHLDGRPGNLRALKDQWLLVSVAGGACDAACQQHLYLQRQLREGLGKDKDRLDWVWLIPDDAPVPEAMRPALAQATVLRVPAAGLSQWLAPSPGHALADHLYLVDPQGNWMMRFPARLGHCRRRQGQARRRAPSARRQRLGRIRPPLATRPPGAAVNNQTVVDLAPLARLMGMGVLLALGPLAWVWLRNTGAAAGRRTQALTLLTLFLTFDLVLFGAFTRLTDSGLGCPDWPGCYGKASPLGASAAIAAAQSAMPSGPVTPWQSLGRDGPPLPGHRGRRAHPYAGHCQLAAAAPGRVDGRHQPLVAHPHAGVGLPARRLRARSPSP